MLNRLDEIRDDDANDNVVVDVDTSNEMGKEFEEYMKEVKRLETQIDSLKTTVGKLKETQAQAIGSTSQQQSKTIAQRMGRLVDDTRSTVKDVKKGLEEMQNTSKQMKENNGNVATVRIREQQHARLMREFVAILKEYHDVQEAFKQSQTDRLVRSLKIVKKNATDEEIEELLQQQQLNPQDVFKGDGLTQSQKSTLEVFYAEALETRNDIIQLEKQFFEVHELFRDFAMLVQQQDYQIDSILMNVQNAVDYVDKGNENLRTAKSYQQKN